MKRNLWILIGAVLIVLAIAGAYAATRMNSNSAKTTSKSTSSSSTNTQPRPNTGGTTILIIQTKNDPKLGDYLADKDNNPLYTYGGDQQGVSNCTGQCLAEWPAYTATATENLPENVTVITRSDNNAKQYAYKGLPLYTFVSDSPNRPTGDGVNNFHLAKP